MKISIFLLVFFFLLPSTVEAHSGRTDSNGGHNCNVGACAGTYHYHNGGYTAPAPEYVVPIATIKPATPKPTPKPTVKPTPTPTSIPTEIPTTTPTTSPMVQGASTSSDGGDIVGVLGGLGLLLFGGYKGLAWLGRVTAPKDTA